ncbi:hypothetical protein EXH51_26760, partial [Pelomonas saccharophila]|nr:hypothetical protein [Roseateles saccharophilus]
MARHPGWTAGRQLPAQSGTPCGHPQAWRWDTRAGDTDGGGQADPASAAASAATLHRSELQRAQ